ncbi:MAG: TIGR02300 family protein [Holosporaceae bacterium]|nr:TIGR02300 family protein [Holosporaceae bacterium]
MEREKCNSVDTGEECCLANRKWGIKRVCQACNIRFYDFNKSPINCPTCGALFDPEHLYKRKTKNSQEKNDDVESIAVDIAEDILVDETDDEIDALDDEEDIVLENETKE